jgi:sulfur oxidation c-type cytochrome SoxX
MNLKALSICLLIWCSGLCASELGFAIMFNQRAGNCAACHSIPDLKGGKTGIQSTFAPPLDKVATRYSAEQLKQWVIDARHFNPNTLMPPFGINLGNGQLLTDAQIAEVTAALQSLR